MKTRQTKSFLFSWKNSSVSEEMSERGLKVLNIHTFVEVTVLITGYFTYLDFNFVIHNIKFKDPSISNIYAYSPKLHQSYTFGILKAYLQNKYFQPKKYNCAAFINVTEVDKTQEVSYFSYGKHFVSYHDFCSLGWFPLYKYNSTTQHKN